MRLLLLLYLLRVVESNQQALGFLCENVTLSSAADVTSRNIFSIKWYILSNDTWIATYQHGETKTDHFWQYRGRLHLDTLSGDLTINNLIKEDAMQYVVEVRFKGHKEHIHKVDLSVAKRLARPRVTAVFSGLKNGSCFAALKCSSPRSAYVNFTWSVESPATYWTVAKSFNERSAFLFASMGPDHEVRFTCNTTSALESTTDTLAVMCRDQIQEPSKTSNFGHGVLLGSFLGIIFAMTLYIFRDKVKAACQYLHRLIMSVKL